MTEDGATTLEDTVEGGRRNMKRPRRESHDWMGHGNNCGQKSLSRAIMEVRGSTSDVIVALLSSLCPEILILYLCPTHTYVGYLLGHGHPHD